MNFHGNLLVCEEFLQLLLMFMMTELYIILLKNIIYSEAFYYFLIWLCLNSYTLLLLLKFILLTFHLFFKITMWWVFGGTSFQMTSHVQWLIRRFSFKALSSFHPLPELMLNMQLPFLINMLINIGNDQYVLIQSWLERGVTKKLRTAYDDRVETYFYSINNN